VLKDPRICRLFPLWRAALDQAGYAPVVLSPLRRPSEVAASLAKRDDFSLGRAHLIWLRHVLEAERTTRRVPRLLFRWSDFMSDWRGLLDRLRTETGVDMPSRRPESEADVDAFLDIDLRRQKRAADPSPEAPAWIGAAFDNLVRLSDEPSHAGAEAALDEIRAEFDRTAAIYGPVFEGVETEYYAFQVRFEDRLREAEARTAEAWAEARRVEQARADTEAGWTAERRAHEAARAEIDRLATMLQATERARAETEAGWAAERQAHAAAIAHRDHLAREIERRAGEHRALTEQLAATEQARADTEAGWTAEREAAAAQRRTFEAAAARLTGRLETAQVVQLGLEDEVARLDVLRLEAEAEAARLTVLLDQARAEAGRHRSEAEQARAELRRLLDRRRGRPIRTAWAILAGRDA
jgi:hypothetical protein